MGGSCVRKKNINNITPCVIYPRKSRSAPLMHVKVTKDENCDTIHHNRTIDNSNAHYRPILNKLIEKKMVNNYIKRGVINNIS